jgi:PhnB protein
MHPGNVRFVSDKNIEMNERTAPMKKKINYISKGYHSISPILVLRNASQAIKFYQQAFGAEVIERMDRPDGKVMHAAMKIGNSIIMMGEECAPHPGHKRDCVRSPQDLKGSTINLYLYVENADAIIKRAIKAGGKVIMPVADMFWGDRAGMLRDPFGHFWTVATHKEDLNPKQIKERMEKFCKPAK